MNFACKLRSLLWVSVTSSIAAQSNYCRTTSCASLLKRMAHTTREANSENTDRYRVYFQGANGLLSPWHDIPLFANAESQTYNMIVEIPKWTNAKMEIATKEKLNPIKQDVKKGKVRFVNNVFPYKGYIWNYGAIPQTWEDPEFIDEHTGFGGDNDPIDVCEIGEKVGRRGEVKEVKVLGVMALIDEGETDWKVITIDVTDPLAGKMNDVEDVRKYMPGLLEATYDWFKIYKMPTGKPANKFAFDGETKNSEFAKKIIMHTHHCWRKLVQKEIENKQGLSCENVSVEGSSYKLSDEDLNQLASGVGERLDPAPIPMAVDKVYHIRDGVVIES